MNYELHPEVTCEHIADMDFLIAYGQAKEELGFMLAVNETGAYYWSLLEQGMGTEEMEKCASEDFGLSQNEIKKGLYAFLKDLSRRGYITPIGEKRKE